LQRRLGSYRDVQLALDVPKCFVLSWCLDSQGFVSWSRLVPGFGRFTSGRRNGHRRRGAGWHDIEDDAVGTFARSIGIVDLTLGINPPVNLCSTQYGGRKREAEEHD
jgi:hypothetical protein